MSVLRKDQGIQILACLVEGNTASDRRRPCIEAFAEICGDSVHFAQLVKRYERDERDARGQRLGRKRYIGSEPTVITAVPDPAKISTNNIERTNLSARMENARFATAAAVARAAAELRAALR